MSIGEETCGAVTLEDLDLVAVAATAQQETAVGRDVEHAGMGCCGLVADARESVQKKLFCNLLLLLKFLIQIYFLKFQQLILVF